MKTLLGLFLLLVGGLLVSTTVENSFIANSILKIIGVLCFVGISKTMPKDNNLY
jgi:hypothetical protein